MKTEVIQDDPLCIVRRRGRETCLKNSIILSRYTATSLNSVLSHNLVRNLIKMHGEHFSYFSVTKASIFYLTSSEINSVFSSFLYSTIKKILTNIKVIKKFQLTSQLGPQSRLYSLQRSDFSLKMVH